MNDIYCYVCKEKKSNIGAEYENIDFLRIVCADCKEPGVNCEL